MLITKNLKIRIMGNVADYYRKNNIEFILNEYNVLPIEVVNPQSHLIVDAICDVCGKEVKIQYRRYNQSINKGGYYACSSICSKNKREETFINKYGETTLFKTQEFKVKAKETTLKNWGAEHFRLSEKWKRDNNDELQKRKDTIFENFKKENPKVINQDDENFIINCDKHGESKILKSLYSNRKITKTEFCVECNPLSSNVSGKEVLLYKMICDLYDGEVIKSHKINRKEIDIYIPELKLGFEFNGLRWHSELYISKDYHINKTNICKENGVRLVHIFEDDFDGKKPIINSILKNLLNKSDRLYARNTQIKKIDKREIVKQFLIENHLQGFVNSNINYGLYYGEELVSLMTFMKTRKILDKNNNHSEYELVRFCNKLNVSVIGGASKLFKMFVDDYKPSTVLSYCDISWANGGLYKKLGFELIGVTKPNYYYVINHKKENRVNYQKHKLVKLGYDKNLTEVEIMVQRGFYRVFNCGNEKYLYKRD